jgi:hypothetical protein
MSCPAAFHGRRGYHLVYLYDLVLTAGARSIDMILIKASSLPDVISGVH